MVQNVRYKVKGSRRQEDLNPKLSNEYNLTFFLFNPWYLTVYLLEYEEELQRECVREEKERDGEGEWESDGEMRWGRDKEKK
jgi:hypothetical protein